MYYKPKYKTNTYKSILYIRKYCDIRKWLNKYINSGEKTSLLCRMTSTDMPQWCFCHQWTTLLCDIAVLVCVRALNDVHKMTKITHFSEIIPNIKRPNTAIFCVSKVEHNSLTVDGAWWLPFHQYRKAENKESLYNEGNSSAPPLG